MKRIIINLTVLSIAVLTMSSCISTNKGFQSSPVISRSVQLDPIKADIEVDEANKLVGESTSAYFLVFRVMGDKTYADGINYSTTMSTNKLAQYNPASLIREMRLMKVRSSAAYKAITLGDYDFLVHPTYKVTTENYIVYKKYNVEVSGYGAKYKNYRTEKYELPKETKEVNVNVTKGEELEKVDVNIETN